MKKEGSMEQREKERMDEREQIYQNALLLMEGKLFAEAADQFARVPDYRDADRLRAECEAKKATARLDDIYEEADKAAANRNVRSQEKAIRIFERIRGHLDADERIEEARRTIEEILKQERLDREEAIRDAKERELQRKARIKRIIGLSIAAVLVIAAGIAGRSLYKKYAVPALRYRRGVQQMEAGEYDEAYYTFHGMNYRDSSDKVYEISMMWLDNAQAGDTVFFGAYPQGHITSEEKDPVEWLVLEKDGNQLTLITKYAVDALPYMKYNYNRDHIPVTWRTSLLREWLNDTFLETAFDPGEIRMLLRTRQKNGEGSYDTTDRVYLLSVQEAEAYFASDEERKCVPTQFALEFGAYRSSAEGTTLWWLRTPIYSSNDPILQEAGTYATYRIGCVGTSGQVVGVGHYLNCLYGVRPVIRVSTDGPEQLTFTKSGASD